jgi:hypothetical protein
MQAVIQTPSQCHYDDNDHSVIMQSIYTIFSVYETVGVSLQEISKYLLSDEVQ